MTPFFFEFHKFYFKQEVFNSFLFLFFFFEKGLKMDNFFIKNITESILRKETKKIFI